MNEKIKALLIAVANGETLQFFHNGVWCEADSAEALTQLRDCIECENGLEQSMRIKQKTIMIGDLEVP